VSDPDEEQHGMNQQADVERQNTIKESLLSTNAGCLLILVLLLGLPFTLAGGLFVYLGFRSMSDQATLHEMATSVQAIIVSSEVQASVTDGMSSYWADIKFTYEYDGKVRNSDRVWPIEEGASEAEIRALVDRFPPGADVIAFVDPSDPDNAFLEKRWSQMPFISVSIGCVPAVFVAGLGILVSGWKRPRIALLCGLAVASVVIFVLMLTGEHYLRHVPENNRSGWTWLILVGSGVLALGQLAALIKARQLNRQYRAAIMDA
jgi:hypothetical protein